MKMVWVFYSDSRSLCVVLKICIFSAWKKC